MKKIRLAFIGAGFMAQSAHLPSFYSDPRVKIVALSDLDKKLLHQVSKKYQIKKTYQSYKKMLKNEKLDGVVLVVNRLKTEFIAKDVLKAKIHLFSEKPMASNYLSAKKLCDLAKKNKTKYLVGYMKRHDNGILFLKKNLKKNNLGKLISVYYQSFIGDSYSSPFEYFQRQDKDYRKKNTLNKNFKNKKLIFLKYLNCYCHCTNLIRYLFGEVKLNYKILSQSGEGLVFFKSKRNVNIILNNQFSNATRWIEDIKLNFKNGSIYIKMPTPLLKNTSAEITVENYRNGKIYKPGIKWGWAFRNQAKAFVNYIISNRTDESHCLAKDSLQDMKIIESIFKNF